MSDLAELKIVRDLLDEFNNSIEYCHWKSNQHFCDAMIGVDDLDILINRKQYAAVVTILNKLEFKRFYIPQERSYVGIEDYLGFDYETGKLIHLHLHCQLVVGEKHLKGFLLPIESKVLLSRRYDEKFQAYLSGYFDELLLLILRIAMKIRKRDMIKRAQITGSTKDEFEWLKQNCPDFLDELENEKWLTNRIKNQIKKIYSVKIIKWTELNKLKKILYKDLACYSQGTGLHNTFKRNEREFGRIILEIKKRYLKTKYTLTRRRPASGGLTIAFLGSDGAGKSTTIQEIYSWLFQFMDVRLFYLGSGDGKSSLLRLPLRFALKIAQNMGIVKKRNNFSDDKLNEIKDNKVKKVGFFRRLWVYALSKERIKKLTVANRCRQYGYIVLTDRYPQSEFNGLCDGKRLSNQKGIAAKVEKKCFEIADLCPPDLAIKMIVPPEVAVKRKPEELNIETSRSLTERVKQITFSDKTVCVEIDSAQEQNKVWLDVKRAIWEQIG